MLTLFCLANQELAFYWKEYRTRKRRGQGEKPGREAREQRASSERNGTVGDWIAALSFLTRDKKRQACKKSEVPQLAHSPELPEDQCSEHAIVAPTSSDLIDSGGGN